MSARAEVLISDHAHAFRLRRSWFLVQILIVAFSFVLSGSFGCAFGQETSSAMRQTVSVNQLVAPHKARVALARARRALIHGKLDEASSELDRALAAYPTYALAFAVRGSMRIRQSRLEQASNDFQQAIENDPRLGAGYLGLGATYNLLGRFDKALVPLARSVEILPDSWAPHFQIAIAYYHTGQFQAASRELAKAQEIGVSGAEERVAVRQLNAQLALQLNENSTAENNLESNSVARP